MSYDVPRATNTRANALVVASVLSLFLCSLEHPEELVVAVLHILSGSHHCYFALWTSKNRPHKKKKEKKRERQKRKEKKTEPSSL